MTDTVITYKNDQLTIEDVPAASIAQKYGSPCYVYSRAGLEANWQAYDKAFGNYTHKICYAVKANSNLAVLNLLARLGSGFDIVSEGELARVLQAGGSAAQIIFSGVGKTTHAIEQALAADIFCFNVESKSELNRINMLAGKMAKKARIAIRVNPDIDAKTHRYISTGTKENKFGISTHEALAVYKLAASLDHIHVAGIHCHTGSQLTELTPVREACEHVMALVAEIEQQGIELEFINMGGGLGVPYQNEIIPHVADYVAVLLDVCGTNNKTIICEPGRSIAASTGILLTQVEYIKHGEHKNFAVVDAAMNDLLRPALYQAWHNIIPVKQTAVETKTYDIVGPVCETGDFLGEERSLAISEGDLLAVTMAGAYGFSMSSNYNSRPRVVELLVDGNKIEVIRQRESLEYLLSLETTVE